MKTNLTLVLLTGLLFSQNLFADSPLTSTDISKAYEDLEIVQLASKADGKLTIELMYYLNESKNPIEFKIAVIHRLGWNIDGKSNATVFFQYLKEKNNVKDIDKFLNQASGDLLICIAYLKALDNYFDLEEAIIYAKKAKLKNTKSFTISIISALIEAQKAMDSDWCKVYNLTNNVRINDSLNRDMKIQASKIIFEYMDLYKDDCK
ncbi:hypothetical protein [Maribacter sp. ACAM166]|uniref:hypothetical protein n=1 Tax=Maribacter sp. ACAM166 TaxID=2508996 RepID=UPI0010FE2FAE|nr:hypothetical protein [Maribacter sp. ACAM166]TLP81337.1 hypothetical protein ES765_04840 [Maribacter sp. ACAM166]